MTLFISKRNPTVYTCLLDGSGLSCYVCGIPYPLSIALMQQVQLLFTIIGVSVILGSFFIFIIWSVTRMQKYKREAWEQMSLLAEITTQEKGKARITHDLHEDFAQVLATVKMFMGQFNLSNDSDTALRQQANHYLDDAMTKVRGIALEYLPYSLQKKNLGDALQEYIRYMNEQYNNLVTLTIKEELPPITTSKAISIYRIVQEVIDNTIKHAEATKLLVSIVFKQEKGTLALITQDNGSGFDYQKELEKAKGAGLATINNRTRLLKGTIEVNSQAGGTMYIIVIPI